MRRIAIIGGESTGKSTLAKKLAAELSCLWVPEYARIFLQQNGLTYTEQDVWEMARGQRVLEQAFEEQASNQLTLIYDTNWVVFYVWLSNAYNYVPDWLSDGLNNYHYDLTLLCAPTIPWEPDPMREHPHLQQYFFERYQQVCNQFSIPFQIVDPLIADAENLGLKAKH